MKSKKKRFSSSIFLQLLLIFLATGILIFLILAGSFRYIVSQNLKEYFQPHAEYYIKSIIRDIGTPPNISNAKKIADETKVDMQIVGPGINWSSYKSDINISKLKFISTEKPGVLFARHKHDFFIKIEIKEYKYLFHHNFFARSKANNPLGIAVLITIISIIIVCYFLLKRILKPIRWIEEGTIMFSQGQFDHKIQIRKDDELGRLTEKINHMAQEIKKMLESKRQLLLAISHELRTPITRTKLSLEFLEETAIKEKIAEDIDEMENLLADLLESEKLSSDYASLNLSEESIIAIIHRSIEKYFSNHKNRISLAPIPENIKACVDIFRIELLVKNIISNGLKYSNGSVEVSVIKITENNSPTCNITITDSGIGIPEKSISHITEPFYKVDKSRNSEAGGHGLGLYLCDLIVKAHKGRIEFDSIEGRGTTVNIYLPTTK